MKEEKSCDQYQNVKKSAVINQELNHKEENEGYKWKVSSCFSNSKFLCQERLCLFDFIEEKNDIFVEVYKENQVVNS